MSRRRDNLVVAVVATLAALVLGGVAVHAGDVRLTWNASPTATGYNVHIGTASGNYADPVDVGSVLAYTAANLADGCVQHFAALSAYNSAGESSLTDEVSFYPRPVILLVASPVEFPTELHITGGNFASGVIVRIDGALVSPTFQTCTLVKVPAQPWASVQVCNATVCFTHVLTPPAPPTGMVVN